MVEMILQDPTKFDVKVNEKLLLKSDECNGKLHFKDRVSRTAFQLVCDKGHSNIADMLIEKSTEFNIDLNAKDDLGGSTAYHLACRLSYEAPTKTTCFTV